MKKFAAVILSFCLTLPMIGCNTSEKMGHGNQVVATAGDQKVYLRDMMYYMGTYRSSYEQMLLSFGYEEDELEEYWQSDLDDERTMEQDLIYSSLTQSQKDATLLALAKQEGFSYDKDFINQTKRSVDQVVMSMGSKEKLGERVFYETYYVTPKELIEAEKNISIINNYKADITDKIEVSDEELQTYYDENIEMLEEITVQHVLIKAGEGEERDLEEGLVIAEEVLAKAKEGTDFAELVQEYSDDTASIETSGEYKVTRSSNYVVEFMDWAFDSSDGDMGIVESEYGYHVMKYISAASFEDLSEKMADQIKSSKATLLIEQLIEDAGYEWEVDEDVYNSISLF